MADWLWETVEERGNDGGRADINVLGTKPRSAINRILAEELKRALGTKDYKRKRARGARRWLRRRSRCRGAARPE